MSPRITLTSCGSSSRLERLRKCPIRVIRSSSRDACLKEPFSSSTVIGVPGGGGVLPYVSAKAAIIGFTRTLARLVGDFNINVNTLMPGSTLTERVKRRQSKEYIDAYTAQRCLKRPGQPQDLIGAAVFLSSDDSSFITGQTILVDGGRGML